MVKILKPARTTLAVGTLLVVYMLLARHAVAAEITVADLLAGAVANANEQQYPEIAQAITRFRNRDVAGARELLETAKQKDPKLPPPELLLAGLYGAAGQIAAVRAELERAAVNYPNDPEAYLILADLAIQDRRVTEGEALYQKCAPLIESFTENGKRKRKFESRVNAGLATVSQVREQWDSAIKHLQAWLQLEPDSVTAHQHLGRALFKKGNAREAYKEYQAAASLDPKTLNPDIAMARLYEEAKDHENAVKFVSYAVRTNPQDINVQLSAAEWAIATSQLKDAEKYADAAIKVDSKSIEAQLLRGRIARLLGDLATAESMFEQAHLLAPGNFNASNLLALTLAEQNDAAKQNRALQLAEVNARATTTSSRFIPEAFATLGWTLYRLGRTAEAEQALNRVLSSGSLSPDSAFYVAKILVDRARYNDAAKLLESALKAPVPFAQRDATQALLTQIAGKVGPVTPDTPPVEGNPVLPDTPK